MVQPLPVAEQIGMVLGTRIAFQQMLQVFLEEKGGNGFVIITVQRDLVAGQGILDVIGNDHNGDQGIEAAQHPGDFQMVMFPLERP